MGSVMGLVLGSVMGFDLVSAMWSVRGPDSGLGVMWSVTSGPSKTVQCPRREVHKLPQSFKILSSEQCRYRAARVAG